MGERQTITVTPNLARVIAGNVGLTVSIPQITSIAAGNVELRGGCIRRLFYRNDSTDLTYIEFDNGDTVSESEVNNLKDFRDGFECAAKYGLGATFCVDRDNRSMSMLNLYPCLCECKDGKGHGQPAEAFRTLAAGG